jgi:hypothetical protein
MKTDWRKELGLLLSTDDFKNKLFNIVRDHHLENAQYIYDSLLGSLLEELKGFKEHPESWILGVATKMVTWSGHKFYKTFIKPSRTIEIGEGFELQDEDEPLSPPDVDKETQNMIIDACTASLVKEGYDPYALVGRVIKQPFYKWNEDERHWMPRYKNITVFLARHSTLPEKAVRKSYLKFFIELQKRCVAMYEQFRIDKIKRN